MRSGCDFFHGLVEGVNVLTAFAIGGLYFSDLSANSFHESPVPGV